MTVKSSETLPKSHKLFRHSILFDARVWAFLKRVDAAEAETCRAAGCPHCGGDLHSASYLRKPYGLSADLRDDAWRFTLCCSVCRRRVQPPSVRFFGRRFYVGTLFLVMNALAVAAGVRLQTIARRYGIPASTLRCWRRWWQETFPTTPEWRVKRGALAPPPREAPTALANAFDPGFRPALAAVAQSGLADAVDRLLHARCRAGFSRRKRYCHE